jgi:hypothetical protein
VKRPEERSTAAQALAARVAPRLRAARHRHPFLVLRAARWLVRHQYSHFVRECEELFSDLWPALKAANVTGAPGETGASDEALWHAARFLRDEDQEHLS